VIGQLGLFPSAAPQSFTDPPQSFTDPPVVPPAPVAPVAPVETVTLCRACRWGEDGGRYCAALLASAPETALPAGDWIMAGGKGACPSWRRRSATNQRSTK